MLEKFLKGTYSFERQLGKNIVFSKDEIAIIHKRKAFWEKLVHIENLINLPYFSQINQSELNMLLGEKGFEAKENDDLKEWEAMDQAIRNKKYGSVDLPKFKWINPTTQKAEDDTPFINFFIPFIKYAKGRLDEQINKCGTRYLVNDNLQKDMVKILIGHLYKLCIRVLILELNVCREENQLQGENATERMEFYSNVILKDAFDGNGTEETGKAAVEIDKQIALKYEGKLTDNKVQQMMSEFKPTQDLHGMNAKYIYQNALQSSVFSHFADIDGSWNGLSVADVFGDKEIKVGYVNGWLSTSQNMAKIFIVLSLVIILLIAPVFSGEYGGVDNIILTSKYGKTKCATAKVLASLLSAVFITTLVVIFNLLIAVAIYGTEGLDCSILFAPIDFLEGYIPFNITCGTVLKYQILLAFMSAISVTGIVLILSAVCKSQMVAFVISAAIHVIPIMLPISETSALYRIIVLMPLFYSQYISIMSVEQMHNGMLYAVWSIPVAIALVVIGSIISHKAFSKHQVR